MLFPIGLFNQVNLRVRNYVFQVITFIRAFCQQFGLCTEAQLEYIKRQSLFHSLADKIHHGASVRRFQIKPQDFSEIRIKWRKGRYKFEHEKQF